MSIMIPSHLTDEELIEATPRLAGDERQVLARLVAHLAELDRRRLYVGRGYSSLYVYCREGLGYSEDAAHNRKVTAQVARRYPVVVDMLGDGRLSLTAVRLLAPVLRDDNWPAVFAEAAGKSKREVEGLVARLAPKPDVPSTVRKLPVRSAAVPERRGESDERADQGDAAGAVPERQVEGGEAPDANPKRRETGGHAATKRPIVAPLSADHFRVQFTIGDETERKLRRLQELLRREIPSGDPALIFDRALTTLLAEVESRKHGASARPRKASAPRPGSRCVPAATRREVAPRDSRQCTFVGAGGRRCTERAYLEYHHAGRPFAHGGGPGAENIALHCRAHNAYEGERIFGRFLPPEVREARALYDAMRFPVPERRFPVPERRFPVPERRPGADPHLAPEGFSP